MTKIPHPRSLHLLLAAGAFAALAGCSSYPLGLTRAEWESLPPAKQAEYAKLQKVKEGQDRVDADRSRSTTDRMVQETERSHTAK